MRPRALRPGNPIIKPVTFGFIRAALGWVVGLPVILLVATLFPDANSVVTVASLAIPRFALSALLIHYFFQPRGGLGETGLWALASVIVASVIDVVLLMNFENIEWLRVPWC